MVKFIIQRIIYMIITLFIIASLSFFLMKIMPGTPFNSQSKLTAEQLNIMKDKYGLNDPIPVQYAHYMFGLLKGDLGTSFQLDNRSVTSILASRVGPSAELGVEAMVIGVVFGVLLGVLAAFKRNTWVDYSSTFIAVLGKSIPSFVFAAVLQYFLAVKFQLFPVAYWQSFASTILPSIALAMFPLATAARFMRTELIDVLNSDYITLARAKGVGSLGIAFKHAVRNALIPLITVMGPLAVSLITGSLTIEKVFAIPGIGQQFVTSILTNDYGVIMGTTMLFAVLFVVIILVVDILYGVIDPRIRISGGRK
ncbi:oligopeptide ABC transporter permease [Heyndrickxia ginsengihumi]|uniref:ABC transporter permease n=1 Tax=Heyndrickxia ginsengihumi TaxID=363870 RepID=A0A0A6VBF1_9BACI|nr:oligopeptide ABC transporter permease [Heyndrickxia ginsengihumi]KHD85590.1 peptide ABC transporter permease [Heyndrickxia ginsengihumi]MBE6184020.1 ABC transporter permease [Bacillus sp. (in: firmicutes)]MCM3023565.1 ABC transporter permease [Heyndrickxia ginsengihumi]NEY18830.1 ABC transporter permease [Heyndrickxia ginsengihumi]